MELKPEINLRRAQKTDIETIKQIYAETVLTVCSTDYKTNELKIWASLGQNTERWRERIKNQYFLIAELSKNIVGFASLSPDGYLDVFYVHKDHQSKGIALFLYNELEQQALRLSLKTITSDVSITAKAFFKKRGFSIIKEQQNHLEGEILINYKMEKKI